jgi:hypothetical protein
LAWQQASPEQGPRSGDHFRADSFRGLCGDDGDWSAIV